MPCLLALLLPLSTTFAADDLRPDSTAPMADHLFRNQAYFASRAVDLFPRDGTDYSLPDVTSRSPLLLRAITRYDMNLDPVGQEYDKDACSGFDGGQKLSRIGDNYRLEGAVGSDDPLSVGPDDPVLFIERAAIFDDSESNFGGDLQANFKVDVFPVVFDQSKGIFFTGPCGDLSIPVAPIPLGIWYGLAPGFKTKLRGPFWTGEKFEVGDTDFEDTGLKPQIIHYQRLGVWNWNWCPEVSAVVLRVWEGDAGFGDDDAAFIIVHREETTDKSLTISDTGDLVELSLTPAGHLHRFVADASGKDGLRGWPRIASNPDVHNVDLTVSTRTFRSISEAAPERFGDRYGFAGNQVRGGVTVGPGCVSTCTMPIEKADYDLGCGSKPLEYVDDVSLIGGWDCSFTSNDLADRLAFQIGPDDTAILQQQGSIGCGFDCWDKASLFFRSSVAYLPREVVVKRIGPIELAGGSIESYSLPRQPGYDGIAFSEVLGYRDFDNVDLGFRLTKSATNTNFIFRVETLGGSGGSIRLRFTSVEWPIASMAADLRTAALTTLGAGEDGFRVVDVPIPDRSRPYLTLHELLVYDPASDDDMGWITTHEALGDRVSFSIAQAAGNNDAHLESEATILQFRDIRPPLLTVRVEPESLWPPDHRLRPVTAHLEASDNCDPDPSIILVSIKASEAEDGRGDGKSSPDIAEAEYATRDDSFALRAERSGQRGGRVYSIVYQATDEAGNNVLDTTLVTVSHDQRSVRSSPLARIAPPTYTLALGPALPNPTFGAVSIRFTMAEEGPARIRVYDMAGRLVKTLVDGRAVSGPHEILWDASDDRGHSVGSGVYFYRMEAGSWRSQRKVVFLRR